MRLDIEQNLLKVYNYINHFRDRNGYPPSIREIKKALNIKSTSSVHLYLKKLNNKGLINIQAKNKSRAIELPLISKNKQSEISNIPYIKDVYQLENTQFEDFYFISKSLFPQKELFIFKMNGQNLPDEGIANGDLLIIKKQVSAKEGDIALMIINNALKIQKYNQYKKLINSPANVSNLYENVNIVGIIIGLIRNNI